MRYPLMIGAAAVVLVASVHPGHASAVVQMVEPAGACGHGFDALDSIPTPRLSGQPDVLAIQMALSDPSACRLAAEMAAASLAVPPEEPATLSNLPGRDVLGFTLAGAGLIGWVLQRRRTDETWLDGEDG